MLVDGVAGLGASAFGVAMGCEGRSPPGGVAKAGANAPPKAGGTTGLEVGNMAMEIDGEDIDGQPFKLSDYRGKVVVLDFWGNW